MCVLAASSALPSACACRLKDANATASSPVTLVYPDYAPLGIARGKTRAHYLHAYAGLKALTAVEIYHSLHFVMFDRPRRFAAVLKQFLFRGHREPRSH